MSNVVIVAIPDENDRVWEVSSEKIPHLTLLFLGEESKVANLDQIMQFVEHAADTALTRFYLPVDRRDTLGADNADVLFFKKGRYDFKAIRDFRATLLQDSNIKTAYDSATQFEGPWQPHLTLGYPATPAKPIPANDISRFYDVSFNKIAIWAGDFQGPDFLLKDYWDEGNDEIDVPTPMDVAMSGMNQARMAAGLEAIEHHGVKGMRWGQRKTEQVTVGGKTKQVTPKKAGKLDKQWEEKIYTVPGAVDVHNAMADHFNSRIGAINDKHPTINLHERPHDPDAKAYEADVNKLYTAAYFHAVTQVHGTSPTGKKKAVLVGEGDNMSIQVTGNEAKHDAVSEPDLELKVRLDASGKIMQVNYAKEDLTHAFGLGAEFLEHFGVKGMRWGVRTQQVGSGAKKVGGGVKKAVGATSRFVQDVNFESRVESGKAREAVVAAAHQDFHSKDLKAINAKPEHVKASKLKNRLLNPKDPGTKAYRAEVKQAYIKRLETTANSMKNASGTRQYTIRERGHDLPAQGGALPSSKHFWDVSSRQVSHAAAVGDFTRLEVLMDADGFITGLKKVDLPDTLAQTTIHGEAFVESLVHFGIKGMRWGVRKPPPAAISPTASSHVPHGDKRKTKIDVGGGENHPAHEDAIKVAEARIKLKKSGPAALSNQELRDVATRIQLEGQVAVLTSHKGKRFVTQQLQNEGQNLARQGVKKGVKKGAMKIGAAALI